MTMSADQIAREAIRNDHEVIYEVAADHNWVVDKVRNTRKFMLAVKAKIFADVETFVGYERDNWAD
jgi:hypothetical protein